MASFAEISKEKAPKWSDQEYKEGIKRLDLLQDQISNVRTSLPAILKTLSIPYESPEALYTSFEAAVNSTVNSISRLKTDLRGQDIIKALYRAQVSWEENREGGWEALKASDIKERESEQSSWDEQGPEDWIFVNHESMRDVNDGVAELKIEGENDQENDEHMEDAEGQQTTEDEEGDILDDFAKGHPLMNIQRNGQASNFKIALPAPTRMTFSVERSEKSGKGWHYAVKNLDGSRLSETITKCFETRPRGQDLRYALDMIAAYNMFQRFKCSKCNQILDDQALTPAARRLTKSRSDTDGRCWQALHESCLR